MKDTLSIVLAGGKLSTYPVLTDERTKSALPFLGIYRIIDFPLSNLVNSGAKTIGIIVQYLHSSLMDHVGLGQAWDLQGYRRYLKFLPPYVGTTGVQNYVGTADAIYKNRIFIIDFPAARDILIVSGEQVYKYDFNNLLAEHRNRNADVTMLVRRYSKKDPFLNKYAYTRADSKGRITSFQEKPNKPSGDYMSIGIYVFKRAVLLELLQADQANKTSHHILANDVLQRATETHNVYQFVTDAPWFYLGDINDYYMKHQDALKSKPLITPDKWGIHTNLEDRNTGYRPPAHFFSRVSAKNNIVSAGCKIEGFVENSVLSPGVHIHKDARVTNSIIMHDAVIGKNAVVDKTIIEKDTIIGEGTQIGVSGDNTPNKWYPDLLTNGLNLIGKGVNIPPNYILERNVVIFPKTMLVNYDKNIISGSCIGRET